MNTQKLERLIQEYSTEHLTDFLDEAYFTSQPLELSHLLPQGDVFSNASQLGFLDLSDQEKVLVVQTQVDNDLSERSCRRKQFEIGRKILQQQPNYGAGLFVFYDQVGNFRFSLIYSIYQGTRRQFSSFKRYTYYVSPNITNRTFKQQILASDFSSLQKIQEAFSVAKVTDEFFDDYKKLFEKLIEHIDSDDHFPGFADQKGIDHHDVAKKLLGQVAFLYFLQKKGWLGATREARVDEGDKNFMRSLFQKYQAEKTIKEGDEEFNFFNNYLEYLFYDTLNQESEYSANFYRERFDCQIPYLDGGLFEPIPGYKWRERFLKIPDDVFSSQDETGIFDIFDRYNFTIDENSADDQEVSVDPEMLGKVFERLLDTRKETGAFYTPREIVSYMTKQSLVRHLEVNTGASSELINELVHNHFVTDPDRTKRELQEINDSLKNIKIIDPAVGSGAFPVGMLQELSAIRQFCEVHISGKKRSFYEIKSEILENNLYGVDIDHGAIDISRLRFWLSLVVDAGIEEVKPLPNLEFKLTAANSLVRLPVQSGQTGNVYDDPELLSKMAELRTKYFRARTAGSKSKIKEDYEKLLTQADNLFASDLQRLLTSYHPFDHSRYAGFFEPNFMFGIDQFDIVIGNPPYGGEKIEDTLKEEMGLGSKDMYGAFISRSIRGNNPLLKQGGILSFIVSDTFMTLKTHKPLREQILDTQINKMIRVHSDTFKATVNTAIVLLENKQAQNDHICEMADLTNVSVHENYDEFVRVLSETRKEDNASVSTERYAIFYYYQNLISSITSKPFFVGSPKLLELLNDTSIAKSKKQIAKGEIDVRLIDFDGATIELVRFGDIADVCQGLATGYNKAYFFQESTARGSYRDISIYREFVLKPEEILRISSDDALRKKAIKRGFHKSKSEDDFDSDLWFGGRYILPYDKGGAGDIENGWLPNYNIPTEYFIDWSTESLKLMSTLTIKQRNRIENKPGGSDNLCAVIRNPETYFQEGLTFSWTGFYAPTYRLAAVGPYDHGSSDIFFDELSKYFVMGILCSKLGKYLARNVVNHTVNFGVDDVKEILLPASEVSEIRKSVQKICSKQENNKYYDYMSNEQKEIDQLVYKAYGLNEYDIQEVEKWYARRYPKLRRWCYIDSE
jgi:type I restriction-modification system DNA methylase subunit